MPNPLRRKTFVVPIFIGSLLFNFFFLFVHLQYPVSLQSAFKDVGRALRPRTHYVCGVFKGGLGNVMFQYASTYGMAKRKGMEAGIFADNELYKLFNITTTPVPDAKICSRANGFYERRPCAYDAESLDFEPNQNVRHVSYLQSWNYFKHVESDIRKQFTFRTKIRDVADNIIRKAVYKHFVNRTRLISNLTTVGIHVRRGDIMSPKKLTYGYNVANRQFIARALAYYRNKYDNTLFLVFTNPNKKDNLWCKKHVIGDDVILMPPNAREVDMCVISKCNHTIMTVGTFGWWASWLNKGETVYFKHVAQENSSLRKDFSQDMKDYFYPGWITV